MEEKTKLKNIRFQILIVLAIIILCIGISPIGLQNDTFYTIKIGEHIMQDGIDMQDPFSWHEGLSYTYPHWLYDVGTYFVYCFGGWNGIYLSTVILCCVLGLTIYFTNKKLTKNKIVSFVLTIGVMFLVKPYIAARAQLPTFILFVLTIYFIEQFLETKKKRYAIGLILISLLIANLHVAVWPFYFVLYLPYIGEYLLCVLSDFHILYRLQKVWYKILKRLTKKNPKSVQALEEKLNEIEKLQSKRKEKQKENRENPYKIKMRKNSAIKWLILVLVISILMGFCTPLGMTPYTYLVKTMQGNTTQNINEHLPLTLINQKDILCIMAAVVAILMLTKIKIKLSDLFLITGLALLCFISRRQISLFLILGVLVLNRLICSFLEMYDKEGKDLKRVTNFMMSIVGEILILVIVISMAYSVLIVKIKGKEKYISTTSYPVQASEYILENLDVQNIRLYNEYNYGSYLLFKDIPVFIDSRADLYAPEFNPGHDIFSDFLNISNIGIYYETKFKEYDFTHILVYKNAKLNMFLSRDSNYHQIYADPSFVLYERLTK